MKSKNNKEDRKFCIFLNILKSIILILLLSFIYKFVNRVKVDKR